MNPTLFIILILIGALAISAFLSYLLLPVKKKKIYETPTIQIREEENTANIESNDSDIEEKSSYCYADISGYTSTTSSNDCSVAYGYRNSSHDRSTSYVLPSSYDYYKNIYVDFKNKPFFIRNNINNQNWPKYVRYRVTSKEMLSMFKDEARDGDLSYVESENDIYIKLDNDWVLYTEDNYLDLLMKVMEKKRDGIA